MITNNVAVNNKTAFKAAHLEINQQDYIHLVKTLQERLAEHTAQMPDGDRLISTIEPTAFVIRTKYIPGPNAPQGADKLTFLTSSTSAHRKTETFVQELAENLKQPGGFSLKGFLKKTELLIGEGFNRLFTGHKNGEVDYIAKENAYVLRKSGEKIPLD